VVARRFLHEVRNVVIAVLIGGVVLAAAIAAVVGVTALATR